MPRELVIITICVTYLSYQQIARVTRPLLSISERSQKRCMLCWCGAGSQAVLVKGEILLWLSSTSDWNLAQEVANERLH